MQGFANKALIVLPTIETVEARDDRFLGDLKRAVSNIINYCEDFGMTPYALISDSVAVALKEERLQFVANIPNEDVTFMKNNCDGYDDMPSYKTWEGPSIDKARKTYVPERGMPVDKRFEILVNREKLVSKEVIESFKLVFSIDHASKCRYNLKTKAGDERMLVRVNVLNFMVNTEIGGQAMAPARVLSPEKAMNPVTKWR